MYKSNLITQQLEFQNKIPPLAVVISLYQQSNAMQSNANAYTLSEITPFHNLDYKT